VQAGRSRRDRVAFDVDAERLQERAVVKHNALRNDDLGDDEVFSDNRF
jgi:hypothetical protein